MIIRRGTYKDINWYVVVTYIGTKCAYVAVPDDITLHVFGNLEENDIVDIDDIIPCIHGGCTYFKRGIFKPSGKFSLRDTSLIETDKWCIGWDYAHFGDIDYVLGSRSRMISKVSDEIVIQDVKDVISSIIDVENSHN